MMVKINRGIIFGFSFLFLITSCRQEKQTLFTKLSHNKTGINFRNLLKEDNPEFNIIFYPYFYNGGGVAVGDINNDGLTDIFFTGNMVKNRLFVNKGNLEFEDATVKSHLADKEGWCTGATMVDINEDGWLDIYICRSGLSNSAYRKNLLFINNHDLTFTESAAQYGLDDAGYSTQASFFDYDLDGDLDMFLINQSSPEYSRGRVDFVHLKNQPGDSVLANKLFQNQNRKFKDVTAQAGIKSDVLTFSLGISTCDINQDGWPDIYIANDFKETDYFLINNKNGTFTDSLKDKIGHTSLYAMGMDVADYNNDQLPDMIVLDMLPEGNYAQKMHMGADSYTQYDYLFRNGMFYQYMKNSFQKNNGDGTFSEIGQFAGVSNTDWSWSPLMADFNNDGLKDLFVSNGYRRDNTDIQFIIYSMDQSKKLEQGGKVVNVAEYISHMPSINLPNYIYQNVGDDHFENKVKDWGLDYNSISHGAAYVDLDNDGDLDLITNDTDDYALVFRNNTESFLDSHYLRFKLNGPKKNLFGIGAKVFAFADGKQFYVEQNPVRGYQSSVDQILHLGLGQTNQLDSLRIIWPSGKQQLLKAIHADQTLELSFENAIDQPVRKKTEPALFEEKDDVDFIHKEKLVNDFTRQFLIPGAFSNKGPCLAKADVNHDGLEDIFVGGAKGQPGKVFIQNKNHKFNEFRTSQIVKDSIYEDVGAVFFDAEGDGDYDLFVTSGSYEFEEGSQLLQDRLYINNGKGSFTSSPFPSESDNSHCVVAMDADLDGDMDLFLGGGVLPGKYPMASKSKMYLNDGKGYFEDATANYPEISKLGIVNDGIAADVNGDGKDDLVVVGEWEAPKVFISKGRRLIDESGKYFSEIGSGWWNCVLSHDFDKDGDNDLILGNYGMNSQLKADSLHPLQIFFSDYDGNGSVDPIITHFIGDESYPIIARDDLLGQVPVLKKKFNNYNAYASAKITDILSAEQLSKSNHLNIRTLASVFLENRNGRFTERRLPVEVQQAPVYAAEVMDVNKDGHDDLILAGNSSQNRIYLSRHDANYGLLLLGDGKCNFKYASQIKSGLSVRGDVRSLIQVDDRIIFGVNNSRIRTYKR